jgi:hypothetical protein
MPRNHRHLAGKGQDLPAPAVPTAEVAIVAAMARKAR